MIDIKDISKKAYEKLLHKNFISKMITRRGVTKNSNMKSQISQKNLIKEKESLIKENSIINDFFNFKLVFRHWLNDSKYNNIILRK